MKEAEWLTCTNPSRIRCRKCISLQGVNPQGVQRNAIRSPGLACALQRIMLPSGRITTVLYHTNLDLTAVIR